MPRCAKKKIRSDVFPIYLESIDQLPSEFEGAGDVSVAQDVFDRLLAVGYSAANDTISFGGGWDVSFVRRPSLPERMVEMIGLRSSTTRTLYEIIIDD